MEKGRKGSVCDLEDLHYVNDKKCPVWAATVLGPGSIAVIVTAPINSNDISSKSSQNLFELWRWNTAQLTSLAWWRTSLERSCEWLKRHKHTVEKTINKVQTKGFSHTWYTAVFDRLGWSSCRHAIASTCSTSPKQANPSVQSRTDGRENCNSSISSKSCRSRTWEEQRPRLPVNVPRAPDSRLPSAVFKSTPHRWPLSKQGKNKWLLLFPQFIYIYIYVIIYYIDLRSMTIIYTYNGHAV